MRSKHHFKLKVAKGGFVADEAEKHVDAFEELMDVSMMDQEETVG